MHVLDPFAEIVDHMFIKHPQDELGINKKKKKKKKKVKKGPDNAMFGEKIPLFLKIINECNNINLSNFDFDFQSSGIAFHSGAFSFI